MTVDIKTPIDNSFSTQSAYEIEQIQNEIKRDNYRKDEIDKEIENLQPIIKQYEDESNLSLNKL